MDDLAIISQSFKNNDIHIIICIFSYENDLVLDDLTKDLTYLYPFRYCLEKNKILNIQDFLKIQDKYNLVLDIKLFGNTKKIKNKKYITFRSPKVYDLKTFKPITDNISLKCSLSNNLNHLLCIIFPETDPFKRGVILKEAINYGVKTFVLVSEPSDNIDSLATLMCRYLLKQKINLENIIKIDWDISTTNLSEFIIEILYIINTLDYHNYQNYFIACSSERIQIISKTIRRLRKNGLINIRFRYICPF